MIAKSPTVTVTIRAIMARINRKLAHDGQILKVSRSAAEKQNLGAYHVLDTNTNAVTAYHIADLAKWIADEFPGMLKPFEKIEG
ncbi:hypothetical protein [Paraburkholderia heleia]|uniref:hypothetical protein n=1 Tax=Paraburkholderia heleia TaxID=634127 RepID=UPI0005A62245|nr:hypothetical protein [Paraburkholderia heleia]